MFASKLKQLSTSKKLIILCAAVTVAILAVVFAVIMNARSRVPAYVFEVKGLDAETPSQAQAELREDYERFAKLSSEHSGCVWVWAGGEKLYLIKADALKINADNEFASFTGVKFSDNKGSRLKGYIIDPTVQPKELGRIELVNSNEFTYNNVSMSIRVGLRNGEIAYEDAVYLWEKGSSEVLVVRPDTFEMIEDHIVSFTDDGNQTHTCYILDTII